MAPVGESYFLPGTPLPGIAIVNQGSKLNHSTATVKHVYRIQTPAGGDSYKVGIQFGANGGTKVDRFVINFELSPDQKNLRDRVRDFTQKEIVPVAAQHDRTGEFPWDVIRKAFDLGLFTIYIPKKYGGGGLGVLETAILTEELAAGCVGITTSIMINVLGTAPLLIAGTEEQKEQFLIPYCRQLTLASFCFTEPDAGSDPSRISTRAELKGDHYILNGVKHFITNGGVADYYVVFATIDKSLGTKGLTAFLTPSKTAGIKIGKALDKMGQRASNTAEIFFEDVKVPVENRIGAEGEGYKIALQSISKSRINVAAGSVGIARTAMEHAIRHVHKRVQFNQPLANFQYVHFRLADMATQIDAARLMAWRAAWAHDQGRRYAKESSMAKDFNGDVVMKVTSEALDLLGGYGYSKDYPMEKLMRDAKLMQIYEGPSPIHKTIIYRELAKEYGF
ncbi:MAG: acyl-CoA dehydrogenase family protein [Nitrospirae bacterium]|nr:acyl-CoA dehydrogenase family protein [Nitrospirota bacterium]